MTIVLTQNNVRDIPTYRVYRLYDYSTGCSLIKFNIVGQLANSNVPDEIIVKLSIVGLMVKTCVLDLVSQGWSPTSVRAIHSALEFTPSSEEVFHRILRRGCKINK